MESTEGKNWTEEDEKLLLETIDKWVENEVKPIAREYDQEDKYPHELVESMKDLGLFGATISPEYGGMGLPASVYAKVIIKVASVWMAPSGIFNSHLIMASAIERCGTDEQKTNWLPKMASGEFRGGIALTEPNAGTDLQAILTRADRNEQGYLLNGTKMWITNSMYGNCLLVLAKTDLKAKPAHKGMSAFLCQKNEGYEVSKKLKKLGYRSIDSCELTLVDKQLSSDALLGDEEGRGLQQVLGGLELGRINVAARGAGIAEGALKMAVDYAQERETFGQPISQHQAVQLKLAKMATRVVKALPSLKVPSPATASIANGIFASPTSERTLVARSSPSNRTKSAPILRNSSTSSVRRTTLSVLTPLVLAN